MSGLRVERAEGGGLLRLIVDVPKGNVYTGAVMAAIEAAIEAAVAEPAVRLITLEGEGRHFSFGASVEEHTADRVAEMLPGLRRLVLRVLRAPVPVAAVVQGLCLGGAFEVVMACHLLIASTDARFGLPEIKLGVFPPVAAALLPRRVGGGLAQRLILTGDELDAEALARMGWAHRVCAPEQLAEQALDVFRGSFAPRSAAALRLACEATAAPLLAGLEAELCDQERLYLDRLMSTHDANEGISAFLGRRTPAWRHA